MWEEPRWKVFCMYKWGVYIAKGKTNPCGCSNSLITVWLTWFFNFTWLFRFRCGSLGLPRYITLITTVWLIEVMWPTWLMTWLDKIVLVCSCWWWCPCRVVVLLSDGCALGVSYLHLDMKRSVESLMVLVFSWCCMCTSFLSILLWNSSHVRLFAKKNLLRCIIHSWKNILACIIHSSFCEQISLHVLCLFIPFIIASCLIHVIVSTITHDETTSNP